jgi:hypothetical protein
MEFISEMRLSTEANKRSKLVLQRNQRFALEGAPISVTSVGFLLRASGSLFAESPVGKDSVMPCIAFCDSVCDPSGDGAPDQSAHEGDNRSCNVSHACRMVPKNDRRCGEGSLVQFT